MKARIFRPSKSATQSGKARTRQWLLVFERERPRTIDPLMGWTSSDDMANQVRLAFDTREEAIEYANLKGIAFDLIEDAPAIARTISYSDNFRSGRAQPWTH